MKKKLILTEQQAAEMIKNAAMSSFYKKFNFLSPNIDTNVVNSQKSTNNQVNLDQKGQLNDKVLNLNSSEGFAAYRDICQRYINQRKFNLLNITGDMLANSAKNAYNRTQSYIPPELALAQLTLEGGFVNNPNARPIRTKNPFNVGNVDTGQNVFHSSVQSGIDRYYDLMSRSYLTKNRDMRDLLNNFVNVKGYRYATAPNYEASLKKLINSIYTISNPIYARLV